jgi:ABC-type branched-subunit amino acid transport system substrate-binding protein
MIGPDPVTFINQAKQLDYSPKIVTHVGIQDALAMKDVDQKMFEGIVLVNWNESPSVFKDKFTKEYGIMPDKSADKAYDAVYVLSEAVSKATSSESLPYTLRTKEYKTPNGSFGFNENNSAKNTPVLVQKIKDGKLVMFE